MADGATPAGDVVIDVGIEVVIKEMGLTPAGFARTLPNAAGAWLVEGAGLQYRLRDPEDPARLVEIILTVLPERRIASICLPVTRVELRFSGMDSDRQQAFLARFDLYYQKGGG